MLLKVPSTNTKSNKSTIQHRSVSRETSEEREITNLHLRNTQERHRTYNSYDACKTNLQRRKNSQA